MADQQQRAADPEDRVQRAPTTATISRVSLKAWSASGVVIASIGGRQAVLEGLVEDQPDRGEQQDDEVAEPAIRDPQR